MMTTMTAPDLADALAALRDKVAGVRLGLASPSADVARAAQIAAAAQPAWAATPHTERSAILRRCGHLAGPRG